MPKKIFVTYRSSPVDRVTFPHFMSGNVAKEQPATIASSESNS